MVECITPFPVVAGSTTPIAPIRIRSAASLSNSQAQAAVEARYVQKQRAGRDTCRASDCRRGMAVGVTLPLLPIPMEGPGVPLSIWTNDYVDLNTGSGQTCHQGDYAGGCSANISQPAISSRISRIAIPIFQPTWCGICSMRMTMPLAGPT